MSSRPRTGFLLQDRFNLFILVYFVDFFHSFSYSSRRIHILLIVGDTAAAAVVATLCVDDK